VGGVVALAGAGVTAREGKERTSVEGFDRTKRREGGRRSSLGDVAEGEVAFSLEHGSLLRREALELGLSSDVVLPCDSIGRKQIQSILASSFDGRTDDATRRSQERRTSAIV
jgi:hypothetical protein